MIATGVYSEFICTLTHVVAPFTAVMCIFVVSRMEPRKLPSFVWVKGVLFCIAVQQFSKLLAPPELNVNVAFDIHSELKGLFEVYWKYWLFNVVLDAVILFVMEHILKVLVRMFVQLPSKKGFPAKPSTTSQEVPKEHKKEPLKASKNEGKKSSKNETSKKKNK